MRRMLTINELAEKLNIDSSDKIDSNGFYTDKDQYNNPTLYYGDGYPIIGVNEENQVEVGDIEHHLKLTGTGTRPLYRDEKGNVKPVALISDIPSIPEPPKPVEGKKLYKHTVGLKFKAKDGQSSDMHLYRAFFNVYDYYNEKVYTLIDQITPEKVERWIKSLADGRAIIGGIFCLDDISTPHVIAHSGTINPFSYPPTWESGQDTYLAPEIGIAVVFKGTELVIDKVNFVQSQEMNVPEVVIGG